MSLETTDDTTATPEERGVTTISASPAQVLHGTPVGVGGIADCSSCNCPLGEGHEVALRATRMSDESEWSASAVHCRDCLAEFGEIRHATLGASELVIAGVLAVEADYAAQTHHLAFAPDDGEPAVLDYSPPSDGSR